MTASPTPPDAQVGLPSEEVIARIVENAQSGFLTDREAARAILDRIRPAFEAKGRYLTNTLDAMRIAFERGDDWKGRALSAEAKLAQAVEDEREACAQIAMMVADNGIATSAAIRARSIADQTQT